MKNLLAANIVLMARGKIDPTTILYGRTQARQERIVVGSILDPSMVATITQQNQKWTVIINNTTENEGTQVNGIKNKEDAELIAREALVSRGGGFLHIYDRHDQLIETRPVYSDHFSKKARN